MIPCGAVAKSRPDIERPVFNSPTGPDFTPSQFSVCLLESASAFFFFFFFWKTIKTSFNFGKR